MASLVSISDELKRAKVYEAFKRFDKAVEVYRQLIEQYPVDFRSHFNCGRLLAFHDSTLEEALSMFNTVLILNGTVVEAYGAASALLIKLNRPVEAAECCQQGLLVNSQDQNCMYNLNIALRQIGDIEVAISQCWDMLVYTYNVETSPLLLTQHSAAPTAHTSQHITAVCVKWGNKYGPEYVNNLHRAIQRHSSGACISELVCFTDDPTGIDSDVRCLPFDPSTGAWKGWWLKAQIFATSEHLLGWVLYIDLDTVICSSLGFIRDLTSLTGSSITQSEPTDTICDAKVQLSANNTSRIFVLGAETFQNEGNGLYLKCHGCAFLSYNTLASSIRMFYYDPFFYIQRAKWA